MAAKTLEVTARILVAHAKGILTRRFEPLGIANTEENRRLERSAP